MPFYNLQMVNSSEFVRAPRRRSSILSCSLTMLWTETGADTDEWLFLLYSFEVHKKYGWRVNAKLMQCHVQRARATRSPYDDKIYSKHHYLQHIYISSCVFPLIDHIIQPALDYKVSTWTLTTPRSKVSQGHCTFWFVWIAKTQVFSKLLQFGWCSCQPAAKLLTVLKILAN